MSFTSDEAPMMLDILGDSLPQGDYDITAEVLPPLGGPVRVVLPAGRVRLAK